MSRTFGQATWHAKRLAFPTNTLRRYVRERREIFRRKLRSGLEPGNTQECRWWEARGGEEVLFCVRAVKTPSVDKYVAGPRDKRTVVHIQSVPPWATRKLNSQNIQTLKCPPTDTVQHQNTTGTNRSICVTDTPTCFGLYTTIFREITNRSRLHKHTKVSIRKVLRPVTSTLVFLGFPVPESKCWDGSQDSKLPLHASHVALPT